MTQYYLRYNRRFEYSFCRDVKQGSFIFFDYIYKFYELLPQIFVMNVSTDNNPLNITELKSRYGWWINTVILEIAQNSIYQLKWYCPTGMASWQDPGTLSCNLLYQRYNLADLWYLPTRSMHPPYRFLHHCKSQLRPEAIELAQLPPVLVPVRNASLIWNYRDSQPVKRMQFL